MNDNLPCDCEMIEPLIAGKKYELALVNKVLNIQFSITPNKTTKGERG